MMSSGDLNRFFWFAATMGLPLCRSLILLRTRRLYRLQPRYRAGRLSVKALMSSIAPRQSRRNQRRYRSGLRQSSPGDEGENSGQFRPWSLTFPASPTPPACRAAGRGSTPSSQRVPLPAWLNTLFLSLRAMSYILRAVLCFPAQASQRVWPGMAGSRQSLQIPIALALSRHSFAALLEASLCSGGRRLGPSCSFCSSGVFSAFGGETFFGGLGFGSSADFGFPGFVNRRRSSGFSRVGVDEGLVAGSYLPPNLLGSGTRSAKVAPTARLRGPVKEARVRYVRRGGGAG